MDTLTYVSTEITNFFDLSKTSSLNQRAFIKEDNLKIFIYKFKLLNI